MTSLRSTVLLVVFAVAACSGRAAENKSTGAAAAPAPAVAHVQTVAMQPSQGAQSVSGEVVETMDAANYTYVRVKTGSGDIWAATSQFPVKVGDRVTVPLESPMQNFHSQSLNRDFPIIYFASHIAREGEASMPADQNPHGGLAGGAGSATVTEAITPPAGGMTIAQLWADREKLGGRTVTVRGKVVKYNAGIMDRNWIHIQDGSGKASDKTNDLTITTKDATNLGDVITVNGTVTLNKDFGAGYSYVVMLENVAIQK